jgi:hypothetical protein
VILIKYDSGRPHSVRKYLAWKPVNSYFNAAYFMDQRYETGQGFVQCRTGRFVPSVICVWSLRLPANPQISVDSISIKDSLVVERIYRSFYNDTVYAMRSWSYEYDEHRSMVSFVKSEWDMYYGQRKDTTTAAYLYDYQNRIIQAVIANSELRDSQIYSYDNEQLVSAEHWKFRKGKMFPTSKTHYYGWDPTKFSRAPIYVSPEEYDNPPRLAIGSAPFKIASVRSWDPFKKDYRQWYRVTNELNSDGLVARHSTIDSSNLVYALEYGYYPNGDLATTREISLTNDILLGNNINEYSASGMLTFSDQEWVSNKWLLYTATYATSGAAVGLPDVSSDATWNSELHEVFDAIGRRVYLFSGATLDGSQLPLPSGLYFISIDGGKPRKHLIP